MDAYLKRLRTCTPAPGVDRVLYSGMPEQAAANDRTANGIPYHPEVIAWFTETCAELGVEHRLPLAAKPAQAARRQIARCAKIQLLRDQRRREARLTSNRIATDTLKSQQAMFYGTQKS